MQIIKIYFKLHYLKWEELIGFCTDGAPVNLRFYWGLVTFEKKKKSFNFNDTLYHSLLPSYSSKIIIGRISYYYGTDCKINKLCSE